MVAWAAEETEMTFPTLADVYGCKRHPKPKRALGGWCLTTDGLYVLHDDGWRFGLQDWSGWFPTLEQAEERELELLLEDA